MPTGRAAQGTNRDCGVAHAVGHRHLGLLTADVDGDGGRPGGGVAVAVQQLDVDGDGTVVALREDVGGDGHGQAALQLEIVREFPGGRHADRRGRPDVLRVLLALQRVAARIQLQRVLPVCAGGGAGEDLLVGLPVRLIGVGSAPRLLRGPVRLPRGPVLGVRRRLGLWRPDIHRVGTHRFHERLFHRSVRPAVQHRAADCAFVLQLEVGGTFTNERVGRRRGKRFRGHRHRAVGPLGRAPRVASRFDRSAVRADLARLPLGGGIPPRAVDHRQPRRVVGVQLRLGTRGYLREDLAARLKSHAIDRVDVDVATHLELLVEGDPHGGRGDLSLQPDGALQRRRRRSVHAAHPRVLRVGGNRDIGFGPGHGGRVVHGESHRVAGGSGLYGLLHRRVVGHLHHVCVGYLGHQRLLLGCAVQGDAHAH